MKVKGTVPDRYSGPAMAKGKYKGQRVYKSKNGAYYLKPNSKRRRKRYLTRKERTKII